MGKAPSLPRSLNAITTLGAVEEHQIRVTASGAEADAALKALKALVDENFGEPTSQQPVAALPISSSAERGAAKDGSLSSTLISEGIAIGPLYRYQPQPPLISSEPAQNPDDEWGHLQRAINSTRQAISQRRQQLKASIGEAEAAIFDAHLLILDDPDLLEQARRAIFESRQNAMQAWHGAASHVADSYRNLEDVYLRQRGADVDDVSNQVLFALAGKTTSSLITFAEPVILYAPDLTPTETSQLDMNAILGILTSGGGPTSHSAILARALGIPAVSGVSPSLERLPPGTLIALDGFNGAVWVEPSEQVQVELKVPPR